MVVGEDLALEVCKQQVAEGDFGELHAAMRVFCRQKRLDLIEEVLENLDMEDEERLQAVSNALKYELPAEWESIFIQKFQNSDPKLNLLMAKIAGYRRLDYGSILLQSLHNNEISPIKDIIWSLGRLRSWDAQVLLFNDFLMNDDVSIKYEAALALLRIGHRYTIDYCLRNTQKANGSMQLLGLGGPQSCLQRLLQNAQSDQVDENGILALGLLGDISAMDVLFQYLSDQNLSEAASQALYLISGADLFEEVFIPEEIDEDELFEEELEKLKKGEPLYPEGEEPGITISRISQNSDAWVQWWQNNKSKFSGSIRYRNGKPYSPACLLENLKSEKCPRKLRQFAYEELVIRYNADFPFETDMFVDRQKQAITQYEQWLQAHESDFKPGKWYFAGSLIN